MVIACVIGGRKANNKKHLFSFEFIEQYACVGNIFMDFCEQKISVPSNAEISSLAID
jgi:hypothetical protein